MTHQAALKWCESKLGQALDFDGQYGADWMPVNYPGVAKGYYVNRAGQVLSTLTQTPHLMTHSKAIGGYTQVCFTIAPNKTLSIKTHRIVANAFLPNPLNYRCVNHKDENRRNNHVSNLEWCSHLYNNHYSKSAYYKSLLGRGIANIGRFTQEDIADMRMFRKARIKLKDIARVYGTSHTYVCNLVKSERRDARHDQNASAQLV